MDIMTTIISIGSAVGIFAFFFQRLGKKIDRAAEEQKKRTEEHWEYERTVLAAQQADHEVSMRIVDYAISQGCNGNTKDLMDSAKKANSDLNALIQKRATKTI